MKYIVNIPNEASLHTLRSFLLQNDFFPDDATSFELRFHQKFVYLQPFALAMLSAWGSYWRTRGVPIQCGEAYPAGVDYAWRMGLFDHLGVQYQSVRAAHEEAGRFITIRRIGQSAELQAFLTDVAALLHRPEHVKAVQYCLSETIRNVFEHAGGQAGFACAQFYPQARRVSLGVADCGIGILASLSRANNFANSVDALYGALQPGISGATRGMYGAPDNAGVGLFFTKSIAKASRQYFGIISEDAAFRLRRARPGEASHLYIDPRRDRHDLFSGFPRWRGTVAAVDIGIGHLRSFESTMNAIRDAISTPSSERDRPKIRFLR